jgi:hypothetical protein
MRLIFKCPHCDRKTECEVKKITKKTVKEVIFHHLHGMKAHIGLKHKRMATFEYPDIIVK